MAGNDETIKAFVEHLRYERRLSEHTVSAYQRDLGRLCDFLDERSIGRFQQIDTPPGKTVRGRIAPCGSVRALYQPNPVGSEVLLSVSAPRKAGQAKSF